ncbi:MAG TPA: formylglycine-generating enzyme family protein [Fimbriimonas sp.]|nr:formylglycine-generating enzyme family protein [Fimbriimonas sp.]
MKHATAFFVMVSLSGFATAQSGYQLEFNDQQIAAPKSPTDFPAWLAAMKAWRTQQLAEFHYDGSNYDRPEFKWAQSSFVQPQMMIEDRYFYDPKSRTYTVKRYLDDLKKRYGGIDAVLIWPTYPNIGIDDRNTDDMFRSMPGGIPAIKKMVSDFHRNGVKVLFPIHPWDVGTRDPKATWGEVLPATMAEIGADGMNGDTMLAVTKDFFDNSVKDGNPLVYQPEIGLAKTNDQLGWNTMDWGYWDYGPRPPMVSRTKWLEPRHMVNVCDRWSTDKNDLVQYAFFNGVGVETWENVWGIWNQMTDRDSESVRRIATIERAFPDLLTSPDWEPHTPMLQSNNVFASKWPRGGATLWTIVNRSGLEAQGDEIWAPYEAGTRYFDLWNGVELQPRIQGQTATLSFPIEPHGFGAVLAFKGKAPAILGRVCAAMKELSARPLDGFSKANPVLYQTITPLKPTKAASSAPEGMVQIPAAQFDFVMKGIEIEGEDRVGVDVQYPWEKEPRRSHRHTLAVPSFYIDKYPVTNEQFKAFMNSSHYKPADGQNFLRDWKDGTYPDGWARKPVTWVSLEDARAYAAWAGKRLPHEWEWQYAAEGTDGRTYPWGSTWDPSKVPAPDKERSLTPASDVDAFQGGSPFGVMDLVGDVWQWTDEYTDEHTRAAILRGGSHYQPQGSMWYFPQAYRLDQHGKYLLIAPGKDRAGTIGFRCVVDAWP